MTAIRHVSAFLILLFSFYFSHGQQWAWVNRFGAPAGFAFSKSIATDAYGFTYVTGKYSGQTYFGNYSVSGTGAFVAKYDFAGAVKWVVPFVGDCVGNGIALDAKGNVYVTGNFQNAADFAGTMITPQHQGVNAFIAKLDSDGNMKWASWAGDAPFQNGIYNSVGANSIDIDSNGDAYITGSFNRDAKFSKHVTLTAAGPYGASDVYVAKYDTSGIFQWAVQAGGSGEEFANGISIDGDGNAYITGQFYDSAEFAGTQLFCDSTAQACLFVASYDPSGTGLWATQSTGLDTLMSDSIMNMSYAAGMAIAVDKKGNSYVTGHFNGVIDIQSTVLISDVSYKDAFVLKFDNSGTLAWARREGGSNHETGKSVSYDDKSNILHVAGDYTGQAIFDGNIVLPNYGFYDVFIATYDPDYGQLIGLTNAGNPDFGTAMSVAAGPDSSFYVAGYYKQYAMSFYDKPNGTVNFTIPPIGSHTGFVGKYQMGYGTLKTIENSFSLFPNPASDMITIENSIHSNFCVAISSPEGETLAEECADGNKLSMNVAKLTRGIYVVTISTVEGSTVMRLSIEN